MKKENLKWLFIILAIIVLVGGSFSIYYFGFKDKNETREKKEKDRDKKDKKEITEDEKRFKEEYESLNGTIRETTGVEISTIDIMEDNNVKYLSDEEVVEFLENGTGLLYMGFKECPWCRSAVPVLLTAATNIGIKEVYYLDVTNIKSTIVLDAKNKPQVTKEGTTAYYKIMKLLDDYLSDYSLKASNGKMIPTGEKRIYSPTVLTVKDGVVMGFHVGTVEGHDKDKNGVLPEMTKKQSDELYLVYEEMMAKISDNNCNDGCD